MKSAFNSPENISSVFIIIPVHNRRDITLQCLKTLHQNGDLESHKVVVVDDGSTDGTAEAIQASYPLVKVLYGNGQLWWTGAIAKGMEYAYQQGANFFIWLNDDTFPYPDAISQLIKHCSALPNRIAAAQCYATDELVEPTYGGQIKHLLLVQLVSTAPGQRRSCDCMSGNLVCLPRSIVDDIGYPPEKELPHCHTDVVYTLMAKRSGYDLQVLGDAIAVCAFDEIDGGWASSSVPMIERWRQLGSLKSNIHPLTYWVYCNRVFGILGPILFIWVYIKLLGFTVVRWILPLSMVKQLKTIKDFVFQAETK
jgi:GT2 family glycosyltransferase